MLALFVYKDRRFCMETHHVFLCQEYVGSILGQCDFFENEVKNFSKHL